MRDVKVRDMMKNISLEYYWPNFKCVAYCLYNSEIVHLYNHPNYPSDTIFPWNDQFTADTLIVYEDYPTAIVNIERYKDSETIYSLIIHELFHGYQYLYSESRFPNELLGVQYPLLLENIKLRNKERKLLYQAFNEQKKGVKLQLLNEFIFTREKRGELMGEYAQYEFHIESVEGPAWYIESKALQKASNLPFDEILKTYSSTFLDEYRSNLQIRVSCYGSGMFLCLLLDQLTDSWKEAFTRSKKTLYEIFKEHIDILPSHPIKISPDDEAMSIFNYVKGEKEKVFESFINNKGFHLLIEGNMTVTSFDPMNIVSLNNHLLHQNFIKLIISGKDYYFTQPVLARFTEKIQTINQLHLIFEKKPTIFSNHIEIDGIGKIEGIYDESNQVLKVPEKG
ncbi:hypothetical protein [Heyndrickxia vini]|uniref:Peptide ABC transporter permease n=1 Tax=Heyndrickxia vini TaxID=1476025 RepID=A0ABX7E1V6_9BACI|nr:hypothetical protein [Heyndrickxia vini]QQZ09706.1 hypothetical protein I5776_01605 [Heyndrickxia vini]